MLKVKNIRNKGGRGRVSVAPHIKDKISDEMYVKITHTSQNYIPGPQIFQKETGLVHLIIHAGQIIKELNAKIPALPGITPTVHKFFKR